jgi:hypothetical protein
MLFGCMIYVLLPALAVFILLVVAHVLYKWYDSHP